MTTFAMRASPPVLGTVELSADTLTVRLGLGWRAVVLRSSVIAAGHDPRRTLSLGAHGWRGAWLVNTSTRGLVVLTVDPAARGHCLGVPVRVTTLRLSLAEPDAFLRELGAPTRA